MGCDCNGCNICQPDHWKMGFAYLREWLKPNGRVNRYWMEIHRPENLPCKIHPYARNAEELKTEWSGVTVN